MGTLIFRTKFRFPFNLKSAITLCKSVLLLCYRVNLLFVSQGIMTTNFGCDSKNSGFESFKLRKRWFVLKKGVYTNQLDQRGLNSYIVFYWRMSCSTEKSNVWCAQVWYQVVTYSITNKWNLTWISYFTISLKKINEISPEFYHKKEPKISSHILEQAHII